MTDPLLVEVSNDTPAVPLEIIVGEQLLVEVSNDQSPVEISIPGQPVLVEAFSPPEIIEIEVGIPGPPGPPGLPAGEAMPFAKRVDTVDDETIYKGEAAPGSAEADPVWRISRISLIAEDITEQWANGSAEFISAWTERASLDYQ